MWHESASPRLVHWVHGMFREHLILRSLGRQRGSGRGCGGQVSVDVLVWTHGQDKEHTLVSTRGKEGKDRPGGGTEQCGKTVRAGQGRARTDSGCS